MRAPTEDAPLVVVADDDEDIRLLVRAQLERVGFRVDEAVDGLQALQAVTALSPDLLVLDIGMPALDGYAVLRILNNREGRKQRVLILSARGEMVDRVVGLELGADDYLTKPFANAELVARVRAAMRRD